MQAASISAQILSDGGKMSEESAFILPPMMTIEAVDQLADAIRKLPVSGKNSVTLDASCVENITTPGVQLLVSLAATLATQDISLIFNGKSEVFTRAFSDTGLAGFLSK